MNDRICRDHGLPVQLICCQNHNCTLRLQCVRCISLHFQTYQSQQSKEVEDFQAEILNYLEKTVKNDSLSEIKLDVKNMFALMIEQFTKQLTLIQEKFILLIEKVGQIDNEDQQLRDQLRYNSFLQLPNGVINQLVDVQTFQENVAERQREKDESIKAMEKSLSDFKTLSEDYTSQYNKLISETIIAEEFEYQGKSIKLIGRNIAGVKDGEFRYEIDGKSEFAGVYVLNKKHGQWREYALIDGELKESFVQYQKGKQINQDPLGQCIYVDGEWQKINQVNERDEKIGFWKENQNMFQLEGNYRGGFKVEKWKILLNDKEIGGGEYDNFGIKVGTWREPHQIFENNKQLLLEGDYKDGKMIGQWKILFKQPNQEQFEEIGYRNYGDNNQVVYQKDIDDQNFSVNTQILYEGQLTNNQKTGQWMIYFRDVNQEEFQQIGGFQYDSDGKKEGVCRELCQNFSENLQILHETTYSLGMPQKQKILFRQYSQDQFLEIGGGEYNVCGQKTGQWTELWEKFENHKQVIVQGNYRNNKRTGKWKTLFRENQSQDFVEIGGGNYTIGKKEGIWTEISDSFSKDHQIILEGKYQNEKFEVWKEHNRNMKTKSQLFIC